MLSRICKMKLEYCVGQGVVYKTSLVELAKCTEWMFPLNLRSANRIKGSVMMSLE